MKLKLAEYANLAEIIGAFAVVISLIYVGAQVNDSASAVRAASANDVNVALQSWYLEIGTDQQTSELFYEALTSEEALSNEEEFQFLMILHGAFLAFQNSYLQAEEGTIDAELRAEELLWEGDPADAVRAFEVAVLWNPLDPEPRVGRADAPTAFS